MALTIEDGTVVANAQSYSTVAEVRAYASARGVTTLPAADGDVEALIIRAMDFIESFRESFRGYKHERDQALSWPRIGAVVEKYIVYSDEIPQLLKNAVAQLAIDAVSLDLTPNGTGQEIKKSVIGPIETEFFERGTATVEPQLNKAKNLLKPLLHSNRLLNVTRG